MPGDEAITRPIKLVKRGFIFKLVSGFILKSFKSRYIVIRSFQDSDGGGQLSIFLKDRSKAKNEVVSVHKASDCSVEKHSKGKNQICVTIDSKKHLFQCANDKEMAAWMRVRGLATASHELIHHTLPN